MREHVEIQEGDWIMHKGETYLGKAFKCPTIIDGIINLEYYVRDGDVKDYRNVNSYMEDWLTYVPARVFDLFRFIEPMDRIPLGNFTITIEEYVKEKYGVEIKIYYPDPDKVFELITAMNKNDLIEQLNEFCKGKRIIKVHYQCTPFTATNNTYSALVEYVESITNL